MRSWISFALGGGRGGSWVCGRVQCRVGAFKVFARYMLDYFFIAISGKKISRLKQTKNAESSNAALTQTANARTWH
jgi:hypothetical protein